MIPPEQNGEFVARMENLLDTYCLPDDPHIPLICMDEQPVQLIQETRTPYPLAPVNRHGKMMNMSVTAPRISLCSPHPSKVAARSTSASSGPPSTGRRRFNTSWRSSIGFLNELWIFPRLG